MAQQCQQEPAAAVNFPLGTPLEWTSERNQVLVNGRPFRIKGLNWFGFETEDNCLHGLWSGLGKTLTDYLDLISHHGFNALRVPFSVKFALALDKTYPKDANFVAADPSLRGLSSGAILDKLVVEAGKRGIMIMLDQHRLDPERGISDLWYDVDYEEPKVLQSWDVIVGRYKRHWNVFALDLKNENHGPCSWGSGESFTCWKAASERIMKHIAATHPDFKGLFFVGGIWGGGGHWWGGNFRRVREHPVQLGAEELNKRVVYTPHVYGPDVYKQAYFSDLRFPNNLPAIWDAHWGFLRDMQPRAVVVGEWGGFCKGKDAKWQRRLARYLRERGMADNFYWCLNPNSGDTGGILADDWKSLQVEKLQILHELQPAPSRLELSADGKSLRYREGVETQGAAEVAAAGPKTAKKGGWFSSLFSSSKRK